MQLTFFSGKSAEDLPSVVPRTSTSTASCCALGEGGRHRSQRARVTSPKANYDKLILATGSYPFVPPVPGRDQRACHVYRTIEDLEGIRAAGEAKLGVVIGGGLLGLEAAKALRTSD